MPLAGLIDFLDPYNSKHERGLEWPRIGHSTFAIQPKETRMGASGQNNRIDNIEFNVADIARSKRFYGDVFGWTFTDYGPTYSEFTDGRLTGGFTTGEAVRPGGPLVILYGDDLAATRQRITAAGGRISRDEFTFPGGSRFHFTDLDGYELAVWAAAK